LDVDLKELWHLDSQLRSLDALTEIEGIESVREQIASTIYAEVRQLDECAHNKLRKKVKISPEEYLVEMVAFQGWMDFANTPGRDPVIVRAQVITQLYVGFVWLKDSLLKPVKEMLGASTTAAIVEFFDTGDRRLLRNAVAHGRWQYLPDFSGLKHWEDGEHAVLVNDLNAWQLLSRATSIAILLALTDEA